MDHIAFCNKPLSVSLNHSKLQMKPERFLSAMFATMSRSSNILSPKHQLQLFCIKGVVPISFSSLHGNFYSNPEPVRRRVELIWIFIFKFTLHTATLNYLHEFKKKTTRSESLIFPNTVCLLHRDCFHGYQKNNSHHFFWL